jgi:hypothetical protein
MLSISAAPMRISPLAPPPPSRNDWRCADRAALCGRSERTCALPHGVDFGLDHQERTHQGEGGVDAQRAKIDDQTTEYVNHIHASATDEFMAFIQEHGFTLEQAAAARQAASDAHNQEATPNFATSIERHALKQA